MVQERLWSRWRSSGAPAILLGSTILASLGAVHCRVPHKHWALCIASSYKTKSLTRGSPVIGPVFGLPGVLCSAQDRAELCGNQRTQCSEGLALSQSDLVSHPCRSLPLSHSKSDDLLLDAHHVKLSVVGQREGRSARSSHFPYMPATRETLCVSSPRWTP